MINAAVRIGNLRSCAALLCLLDLHVRGTEAYIVARHLREQLAARGYRIALLPEFA